MVWCSAEACQVPSTSSTGISKIQRHTRDRPRARLFAGQSASCRGWGGRPLKHGRPHGSISSVFMDAVVWWVRMSEPFNRRIILTSDDRHNALKAHLPLLLLLWGVGGRRLSPSAAADPQQGVGKADSATAALPLHPQHSRARAATYRRAYGAAALAMPP
jgi:hypothetical protein